QFLDPVQHDVEAGAQTIELVRPAADRNAVREIAAHDGTGRRGNRVHAAEDAAADEQASAQPDHRDKAEAPEKGGADKPLERAAVLDISADEKPAVIGKPDDDGIGLALLGSMRSEAAIDE